LITPTSITLTPDRELKLVWSDGHIVRFALQFLRDECPCAGCKGEHGLFGAFYAPPDAGIVLPGKYELAGIEGVGNYAICIRWKDGHDTGMYSWQYLLDLENRDTAPRT
jgi:DUF971 family protein